MMPVDPTYAFEARNVVKRFGTTTALAGVDLAARPGTVLAVLGPNGAGKTTAVRILATLLLPDDGVVEVGGHDVVHDAARVRRMIGLTGQYASVDEDLTGRENLQLIGRLLDLHKNAARARARELLDEFGLAEAGDRKVATYSGGMRRRIDLATSMIGRPQVVYLDEPTTGLDPGKREELWRTIRAMVDDGGTVLLTTQYLEEADALADEIAVINHGEVIAHGTPAQLKQVVGGQVIAAHPADPDRLSETAAILGQVAGHEPARPSRGVVDVPVVGARSGDAVFAQAVRELSAAGIAMTELALRLPGLDEVFFSLTGEPTATPEGEAKMHQETT